MALDENEVEDVARAIDEYLRINREAADTIEGVAQWWLASMQQPASEHVVAEALEQLVKRGIVEILRTSVGVEIVVRKRQH